MPNIREYSSDVNGLQTSSMGSEAFVQAGRRIGTSYDEAGRSIGSGIAAAGEQAVKYLEHREISQGAAALAGLHDGLTEQWNAIVKETANKDPNDPTVVGQFREKVLEPELEKFRGAFNTEHGQKWAEQQVTSFREHMFQKTSSDMSGLAGHATVINAQQTINSLSNSVYGDPSGLKNALSTYESSIEALITSSPNLKGADAVKLRFDLMQKGKEAIIKSGLIGAIEKNPDTGLSMAADPAFSPYINGAEAKQLASHARTVIRMDQAQRKQDIIAQKQDEKADFNTQANQLYSSTLDADGNPTVLPKDYFKKVIELSKHPGAAQEPALLRALATRGEAKQKEYADGKPATTDGYVYEDFSKRVVLSPDDPEALTAKDIFVARSQGQLSDKHEAFFLKAINDINKDPGRQMAEREFNEFVQGYKSSITKTGLGVGVFPEDDQRYSQFRFAARRRFEQALRDGGAKAATELLDPNSPKYLGSLVPTFQANSKAGMAAKVRNQMQGNNLIAPIQIPTEPDKVRRPGESPDAYMLRMRGGK